MNRNALYASIVKPVQLRKGLLLAARDTLGLLKETGTLQETTDRKLSLLSDLRETMAEVKQLHLRLHQLLPTLEEEPGPKPEDFKDPEEHVTHKVQFIERELDKIEEKLKGLEE